MSKKVNFVACDVLDGFDSLPRFQLQDPVYHDEGESLLQMGFYFLKGQGHKEFVLSLFVISRRANVVVTPSPKHVEESVHQPVFPRRKLAGSHGVPLLQPS